LPAGMEITPYNHHAKAPSFPRSLSPQTKTNPDCIEPSFLSNQFPASFARSGDFDAATRRPVILSEACGLPTNPHDSRRSDFAAPDEMAWLRQPPTGLSTEPLNIIPCEPLQGFFSLWHDLKHRSSASRPSTPSCAIEIAVRIED